MYMYMSVCMPLYLSQKSACGILCICIWTHDVAAVMTYVHHMVKCTSCHKMTVVGR